MYIFFVSARWYPDLFLDLIKPKTGGINLGSDQRIFLRASMRFLSMYGVFPRGWSKTFLEVLAMYISCVWYPQIEFALTAQTKENASGLLRDKHVDILKKYPWFANEIIDARFSRNDCEIVFKNGSSISNLANSSSSKGIRKNSLMVEESALVDNEVLQDALIPIVEHGRLTCGKIGMANPEELSQKVNYYTTAGFRGSDEFNRSLIMLNEMSDCAGKIVLGSDWHLGCWYGRGSTKKQILDKKKNMPYTAFAQNYESKWVGSVDGALVSISKLIKLRELEKLELFCPKDTNGNLELNEYVIGMDVARSSSQSNNKSAIVVLKIIRDNNGRIKQINLVNIIEPENGLNFKEQSVILKRTFYMYGGNNDMAKSRVKAVIIDDNGIGKGLVDKLLEEVEDKEYNVTYSCWDTINDDRKPDKLNAPKVVYAFVAQGKQDASITTFIDYVEGNKLKLYKPFNEITNTKILSDENLRFHYELLSKQTQALLDEIANLKLVKSEKSNAQTLERVVKRIDKDRFSALQYALYYIYLFLEKEEEEVEQDFSQFMIMPQSFDNTSWVDSRY